jgi:hypothetical protein
MPEDFTLDAFKKNLKLRVRLSRLESVCVFRSFFASAGRSLRTEEREPHRAVGGSNLAANVVHGNGGQLCF